MRKFLASASEAFNPSLNGGKSLAVIHMCQDGPQDFIGMGLDLLFIVAPGTLIFIIEKPFLGAQQVKDITQQDDCYLLDSAAFFGGSALGKHKLFPRVSPNKSWEGAVFGFLFAVISIILLKPVILNFLSWTDIIVLGIIIGTVGQIGDLVESLIKRDAGVKDSSGLIPGHGGIFDRFDSILFTAPVILLYLKYFLQ